MAFTLLPTLAPIREIYALPRGPERMAAYLALMCDARGEMRLPLMDVNPMAGEATVAALDALLAAGAERVAETALATARARLGETATEHELTVLLAFADDVAGAWTNRWSADARNRFPENTHVLRNGWVPVLVFGSDAPTPDAITASVYAGVRRTLHQLRFGLPETLNDRLRQEGIALTFAGGGPRFAPDELAAIARALDPFRSSRAEPELFAAMYGDEAARAIGYAQLGIPHLGGFALALAEAGEARFGEP